MLNMIKLRKYNKKGMSNLVVTVLLILISITSIAAISTLIIKISKAPLDLSPAQCISAKSKLIVDISRACYDNVENNIEIKISRKVSDINFDSLEFSIHYDDKSSRVWKCGEGCNTCLLLDEIHTVKNGKEVTRQAGAMDQGNLVRFIEANL